MARPRPLPANPVARKQRQNDERRSEAPDPTLPNVNPAVTHDAPETSAPFTVVCIGASAGGIDALTRMLRATPADSGMAFVVIQHLYPSYESMLSAILGRATSMPVLEVEDHMPVEPDHVYVIPPGKSMVIGHGLLQLAPRTEIRGVHHSIDHFLRSLAEEQGHKSIAVILSGTGTDGTQGTEEVKAAGGITFAQDDSAEQTSMPRSAVAAGAVDFVLSPEEIGAEIGRISRHPYVRPAEREPPETPRGATTFGQIVELLRSTTGVDFSHYKRNTLHRRVTRRMVLHKLEGLKDYLRMLREQPAEIDALYQDILISVTSFFRDPEAYEALKEKVFPRLAAAKHRHDQIRVWVLGCSTGEEAYSIGMAYAEHVEASGGRGPPLQIFATDLNGVGVDKARAGIYAKGIAQDVSPERLRRFFVEVDGSYRIAKPLRDMCVFARQNVLADPPFSRMDLIACRNVLIYLEPILQQRLLPILHYSLRDDGMLWLGKSESIGSFRDLFEVEDPKHKIFSRKPESVRSVSALHLYNGTQNLRRQDVRPPPFREPIGTDPQKEADRIVMARYAPPSVVINGALDIVQFRGDTSPYLSPSPGRASLNLLKMLREGLLVGVRGAVHRARREQASIREEGLRVKANGGYRELNVEVVPLKGAENDPWLLVLFEETEHSVAARLRQAEAQVTAAEGAPARADADGNEREVVRLKQELAAMREYLQSVIEQQEAANEELQSANEEVQSTNEELQSINEELETSKEEIQSSNEELATVNDELQQRNVELSQSINDMTNLLASVQMPIVMLGPDLRIRRFTPPAEKLLNLIQSDVGRPISDIKLNVEIGDLEAMLLEVIENVQPRELDVQDRSGRWHSLRLRPYKTSENRIEGAVLLLVDIDAIKRSEQSVRESEARFALLANSAPVLIWVNGLEGRQFVNRAYLEFLGVDEERVQVYKWTEYVHPEDRDNVLKTYQDGVSKREPFECQFRFLRHDGEYRWMKSIGVPRKAEGGTFLGYIGCTVDVTDLKQAEASLRAADRSKNEFLAMLSHELRNPLAAIRNAVYLLANRSGDEEALERAREVMERQTSAMVRMVDDLLDVSRITRGTIQLRPEVVDLVRVAQDAVDATEHQRASKQQRLTVDLPKEPLLTTADPARLGQMLGNLLSNASKFTPRGGNIWLSLAQVPGAAPARQSIAGAGDAPSAWAELRIRDDGIGVEPSMLARIFEPFVQADTSLGRRDGGMGVGLAVARTLVQLHGGTLTAESAGPSKGCEFVIRIPLRAAAAEPHEGTKVAAVATAAPCRILVVDDNEDAAHSVAMMADFFGHQVAVARDVDACLKLVKDFRPQLILQDIGMPGVDGYTIARRVRAMPEADNALLVALTGYGTADDVRKARAAGFDEHEIKPLEIDVLQQLAARAVRS